MCLVVYNKFPKIATKDIVCYKILKIEDGELVSSVRHFPFKLNVRMRPKGMFKIQAKMNNILGQLAVEEGYFHTYVYPYNAKADANWLGNHDKVYECIIPKGTLYFEGFYGFDSSYASKCLIVKKEKD